MEKLYTHKKMLLVFLACALLVAAFAIYYHARGNNDSGAKATNNQEHAHSYITKHYTEAEIRECERLTGRECM